MALKEQRILRDGMVSGLGGVDSGRTPTILGEDQSAYAINVTMRGGYWETRPGLLQHELDFSDSETRQCFTEQRLQGRGEYRDRSGNTLIVAVVGGRVFRINPIRFEVLEITPTITTTLTAESTAPTVGGSLTFSVADSDGIFEGYPIYLESGKYLVTSVSGTSITAKNITDVDGTVHANGMNVYACNANSPSVDLAYLCQAGDWLVIQDGQSKAILFDGVKSRRAVRSGSKPEVPTGTSMKFVNGRLWVACESNEIAAGDILGGPTDVIVFSEETYLAEGGRFKVDAPITGIFTTNNQDTSTGQGPVLVFTKPPGHVYAINVPAVRDIWKQVQYPIQTVILHSGSTPAPNSISHVNTDVFYRALDGVRSIIASNQDWKHGWGTNPISVEMGRAFNSDDQSLLRYASSIFWKNWLIQTVSPHRTSNGIVHRGLAALDFSTISRMSSKSPPAWEGVWTGVEITSVQRVTVQGEERAFVWALSNRLNELWELRADYEFDKPLDMDEVRILSVVESRALFFRNQFEMKVLQQLELWLDRVRGSVDWEIKFRPNYAVCWFDWGCSKSVCAKYRECNQALESGCYTPADYDPSFKSRFSFPQPTESVEPHNNLPATSIYQVQLRIQWTGHARLRAALLKARVIEEEVYSG